MAVGGTGKGWGYSTSSYNGKLAKRMADIVTRELCEAIRHNHLFVHEELVKKKVYTVTVCSIHVHVHTVYLVLTSARPLLDMRTMYTPPHTCTEHFLWVQLQRMFQGPSTGW